MSRFEYNDGGQTRSLNSGYCVVRSIAIATGMDWADAERLIKDFKKKGKTGNRAISRGVHREDYEPALNSIGWYWQPAPKFEGRKARTYDLSGTVIARQSHHLVAVIDGVAQDIFDPTEKMVYGYWEKVKK